MGTVDERGYRGKIEGEREPGRKHIHVDIIADLLGKERYGDLIVLREGLRICKKSLAARDHIAERDHLGTKHIQLYVYI